MNLKEKIKNLPSTPGVYLYKDSLNNIIYVGKARNLKRRVGNYFQNSKSHSSKVEKLIKHLKDFEYRLTDTEFEALLLECRLIKEYKPMYNSQMNRTQSYTYILVQKDNPLPTIKNTRNPIAKEEDLLFGPYTSKNTVEKALEDIKAYYQILCSNPSINNRLCLNYSLGKCLGMCYKDKAKDEYKRRVEKMISLLEGTDTSILEELKEKMRSESMAQHFEAAAKYKEILNSVNYLISKEKIVDFAKENKKIGMIEDIEGGLKLFLIQGNAMLFSKRYLFSHQNQEQIHEDIKTNILSCFTEDEASPSIILNKDNLDETQIIYSYINKKSSKTIEIHDDWLNTKNQTKLDEGVAKLLEQAISLSSNLNSDLS
ncbi:GIY-YIG nuclease family protein [Alkalibaculum bacchi]|uniref:GIY-YIG nuclease family protein n=1 Tax=Alkalibaculum bacchi TaxID=645887 RepID=UPI0026EEDBED|nr:GIY-YIG nuclease family protein [Alkalibaculum bacchi]